MKTLKQIIFTLVVILILNQGANWLIVSKNNGKKYIDAYSKASKEIKVHVNNESFEEQFSNNSFLKYTIFFKGIFGKTWGYTFQDSYSEKYFNILRFDKYGSQFRYPQTSKINNQELWVTVDSLQYKNPAYGTLTNPILVFKYKGVNKRIDYNSYKKDNKGYPIKDKEENAIYIKVSLEPSEEEYRYSIENYLTYIMPKKEFNQRFKGK